MALVLADRVQETTATTGTGSITLGGAVSGYQSFAVVGNGNTCFYTIVNGSEWEVGTGTYSTTGPSLARTTVLSNSSGTTSPITLVGASSVFLTYPAEKSVNLDASGNVGPLGTITSGVWNGSTVGVAYGGTGVTASSGASSVVLRDANANITFNNFITGATAVTAAAGTTVLTAASPRTQILVGSTTQTFQLPNATTLALGQSFIFVNNSSGALTVKDNASTTVETVPSGGVTQLGATSIATSAGSWGAYSFIPAAVDWGTNALNLATTVISGGTWQGGIVQPTYGGTGLSTFVAANNAIYSSGASTLTAGTLPVAAGGTGITSLTSGYIPYGNGTSSLGSSSSLQFNGTYLVVGGTTPLGGATNPITAFSSTANNYVQTYVYNASTGTSASSDFVAYSNNSTDAHGWADMGFTSSTYADPTYTVTGPNEAYILGSALNSTYTGNLVYATDYTGSANAHQWYVGGFTQAKSAWKMQLTSTGLQLANNLTLSGGTANGVGYLNGSKVLTTGSALTFDGATLGVVSAGVATTLIHGASSIWGAKVIASGSNELQFSGNIASNSGPSIRGVTSGGAAYAPVTVDGSYLASLISGSEQMRLTSTGLGIGTSSPAVKLTVLSSSQQNSLFASSNATSGYAAWQYNTSTVSGYIGNGSALISTASATDFIIRSESALAFGTNGGTERMRLDSSGNLGLGVTPSAWSLLTASQVKNASIAGYINNAYFNANCYYDGTNWRYISNVTNGTAHRLDVGNGAFAFNTAPSGAAGAVATFTQAMTLQASGGLSLGVTTDPGAGSIQLGAGAYVGTGIGTGNTTGTYYGANEVRIYTSAAERTRISSAGGFSVGTTTDPGAGNILAGGGLTMNSSTITTNTTVPAGFNAMSAGPITINTGVTVTVATGANWVIV